MEKVNEARKLMRDLFGDISDLSDISDDNSGPAKTEMGFSQPTAPAPRYKIPKVGTSIQRGDAASRRRAILLAEPIPHQPARRRNTGAGEKRRPPPKVRQERSWDFKRPAPATAPANREQQQPRLTSATTANQKTTSTTQSATTTRERKRPRPAPIGALSSATNQPTFQAGSSFQQSPDAVLRRTAQSTRGSATSIAAPSLPLERPQQPPMAIVAATTIVPSTQKPAGAITITVRLPTGEEIPVPFFPGARNKKYRIRTGSGKWVVRFDKIGRPRYFRRC